MTTTAPPDEGKSIYWEVVGVTGITPGHDDPLPVPSFADLWAQYPPTTYGREDMIVSYDPPRPIDTTFMDRVARPVGVFEQAPTEHVATGPHLESCICGNAWPCDKAGKPLSRDLVMLKPAEPNWPDFATPSAD